MIAEIAVCRRPDGQRGWFLIEKSTAGAWSAMPGQVSLAPFMSVLDNALSLLRQFPHADFTISSRRRSDEIAAAPFDVGPAVLPHIDLAASITVLAPEGYLHDRLFWNTTYRLPGLRELTCAGLKTRFVRALLDERIRRWVEVETVKAIDGEALNRELWVRQGEEWNIRALAPDAFPPDSPPAPTITDEQRERWRRQSELQRIAESQARNRAGEAAHRDAVRRWKSGAA